MVNYLRDYNEATDGELESVGPIYWRGKKSGAFFWHDESEQLSSALPTLDEAKSEADTYAREVLGV